MTSYVVLSHAAVCMKMSIIINPSKGTVYIKTKDDHFFI